MSRAIRKLSRAGYKHVVKPILFCQSPDKAHESMIRTARNLHKIHGEKILSTWNYRNARLEQDIAGLHFVNPIGMSAGLDKNFDLPPISKAIGLGFEIGGSTTAQVCAGNSRPWFHRLPDEKSIVVNVGLANNGVQRNIEKITNYSSSLWNNFPLSASVAMTNTPENVSDTEAINDYCESLRRLEEAKCVSMYEINISCPNTYRGEPFTTPDRLERLLSAVDALELSCPTFIKMPTDRRWKDFSDLLEVASRHRVTGVTIGNLVKDRNKLSHPDALDSSIKGNLSGLPAQKLTNDLIFRTYEKYHDRFIIIGVGGVFSAQDAYDKIKAGASLVTLVTALMFEGPQVVGEINEGLVKLLTIDGFESISEAIGAAHR